MSAVVFPLSSHLRCLPAFAFSSLVLTSFRMALAKRDEEFMSCSPPLGLGNGAGRWLVRSSGGGGSGMWA